MSRTVWLLRIYIVFVLILFPCLFPQPVTVSWTQIRPQRWWNVPAYHRLRHAEGAGQWAHDQQLQLSRIHHWWKEGVWALRPAASCYPSVESETSVCVAFTPVHWLCHVKVLIFSLLCFMLAFFHLFLCRLAAIKTSQRRVSHFSTCLNQE